MHTKLLSCTTAPINRTKLLCCIDWITSISLRSSLHCRSPIVERLRFSFLTATRSQVGFNTPEYTAPNPPRPKQPPITISDFRINLSARIFDLRLDGDNDEPLWALAPIRLTTLLFVFALFALFAMLGGFGFGVGDPLGFMGDEVGLGEQFVVDGGVVGVVWWADCAGWAD